MFKVFYGSLMVLIGTSQLIEGEMMCSLHIIHCDI